MIRMGDGWFAAFDFRYNRSLTTLHVEAAREFCACAEFALRKGYIRGFAENLYAAAELVAKAELLLLARPSLVELPGELRKIGHGIVKSDYNRLAHTGFFSHEHSQLLNLVIGERPAARYLAGSGYAIGHAEAGDRLSRMRDWLDSVGERISR